MKSWLSGLISLVLLVVNFPVKAIDPLTVPSGQNVVSGSVSFSGGNGNLNVYSQSSRAIVNYQSFSVGSDAQVHFDLPHSSAAILNRVVGGSISEIFGRITSDGRVFLVNPNGIHFGNGSFVSVGSLFASTLDISNSNFLNDNYVFNRNGSQGVIENFGTLATNQNGGVINLFSGAINNSGNILGSGGQINLAVGDQINFSKTDGINYQVSVTKALSEKIDGINEAIKNGTDGNVNSSNGLINLEASLEDGIYNLAVNNEGVIEASGLNGNVLLNTNQNIENTGEVEGQYLGIDTGTLRNFGEIKSRGDH